MRAARIAPGELRAAFEVPSAPPLGLEGGDAGPSPPTFCGARALVELEGRFARHLLDCWSAGVSSLLRPAAVAEAI